MSPPQYAPIGFCIYCGARDVKLTREHIIPKRLGGNHVVAQASCEACAKITGKIEQDVLRKIFGVFRLRNGFKIRQGLTSVDLISYQRDGNLQIDKEHPSSFPYMVLGFGIPLPGIVSGQAANHEPKCEAIVIPDEDLLQARAEIGLTTLFNMKDMDLNTLGRMLAKIAHAFIYSEGVRLSRYYLPEIILQKDENVSYYVGGDLGASTMPAAKPAPPGLLHRIVTWDGGGSDGRSIQLVRIQLFADHPSHQAPTYVVAAGEV